MHHAYIMRLLRSSSRRRQFITDGVQLVRMIALISMTVIIKTADSVIGIMGNGTISEMDGGTGDKLKLWRKGSKSCFTWIGKRLVIPAAFFVLQEDFQSATAHDY